MSVHRTTLTAAPRASQSARLRRLLAIAFTLWAKLVFWQGRLGKKIMKKSFSDGWETFNNESNRTELNVSVAVNSLWYRIKTCI